MLRTVASVPCQEYINDKILTHVPAFLSSNPFLFCFLPQRSDLPFENFVNIVFENIVFALWC